MIEAPETPNAAQPETARPMFSGEAPGWARPILFSGLMVRAILVGEKTQTRRIYKPASKYDAEPTAIHQDGSGHGWIAWYGPNPPGAEETVKFYPGNEGFKCPYGLGGDRLYVRESFWECTDNNDRIYYAATETPENTDRRHYRQRPSIHMRRTDSRITIEVVGVRVQRLQDISEEDAIAEGAVFVKHGSGKYNQRLPGWNMIREEAERGHTFCLPTARWAFANFWEKLNGPGSWDLNPWVWAVSFRAV